MRRRCRRRRSCASSCKTRWRANYRGRDSFAVGSARSRTLEGNVVVELAATLVRAASGGRTALIEIVRWGRRLPAGATPAATTTKVGTAASATNAAAAAVEHLHFVGDDFGGVAVVALLVLPLARAQRAFDVHLRTLLEVFAGDLAETAEHGDVVPLGALFVLPRLLVFPVLAGRHA